LCSLAHRRDLGIVSTGTGYDAESDWNNNGMWFTNLYVPSDCSSGGTVLYCFDDPVRLAWFETPPAENVECPARAQVDEDAPLHTIPIGGYFMGLPQAPPSGSAKRRIIMA
jgi:hypothetical protein